MTPCSSLTVPTSGSVRDFNPKDSTHAGRTDLTLKIAPMLGAPTDNALEEQGIV